MVNKINIAIDGYSSCGKSTVAKELAKKLEYGYVDTGAMYRAVTYYLLQNGIIKDGIVDVNMAIDSLNEIKIEFKHNSKTNKSETFLNGVNVESEIRSPQVSKSVSSVSRIKEVREKLTFLQKKLGEQKGIVMDGRDIGAFVLPNAELKIFMISDLDLRVERRYTELRNKGYKTSHSEVKENLLQRDYEDSNRKESPLTQADDAEVIDNSDATIDQLVNHIFTLVNSKINTTPKNVNHND